MPTKKLEPTGEYALVQDGEVATVGPEPSAWENPDGTTTTAPIDTPTDPSLLAQAGYLPVVMADRPTPEGKEVDYYDHVVAKKHVEKVPVYRDLPEPEVHPITQVQDRIAEVEAKLIQFQDEMNNRLAEIQNSIAGTFAGLKDLDVVSVTQRLNDIQGDVRALKRASGGSE